MDILDAEVVSEETVFVPDLDHIPFASMRSGWCNDGHHAPTATSRGCPAVIGGTPWPDPAARHRMIPNPAKRCPCPCHARDLQ